MSFQSQWPRLRAAFSHTQDQLYFNHASVSPFAQPVVEAIQAYAQERHLDCIENYEPLMLRIDALRQRLAMLVGASAEDIALVSNTSAGLSLLANGLDWRKGDRVLLNNLEFPSNVYPFLNLRSRGVAIDFVAHRDYYLPIADILDALTPQTRVLSISHVQFLTGQRHDLETLGKACAERGILFCVDAIQSLGAATVDVNAMHIDFLATGGHKWLMGPQGQGFVYIRPELRKMLQPVDVGWLSVDDAWELLDYRLQLRSDAARYELGTPNGVGITALLAARTFYDGFDRQGWTEHVLALTTALWSGFSQRGLTPLTPESATERLGIVTVPYEGADALQAALAEQNVRVASREQKFLRVSPHGYNSLEEIEAFWKIFDAVSV
jgi:cysteine desulfurase / selenocysteine lyase